ncbi:MAG: hypothetical protein ACRERE_12125 [Candidatus Entotheonellia bacterium]
MESQAASIGDVVGTILTHIAQGQSLADRQCVAIAQEYLKDPLLIGFPIPRMVVSDIEVELKVAVARAPQADRRVVTPQGREEIAKLLGQMLADRPQPVDRRMALPQPPGEAQHQQQAVPPQVDELLRLVPEDGTIHVDSFLTAAADVIKEACVPRPLLSYDIPASAHDQGEGMPFERQRDLQAFPLTDLDSTVRAALSGLKAILARYSAADTTMQALMTTTELEGVPTAHLSTIRLKLTPGNRVWLNQDGHHVLGAL